MPKLTIPLLLETIKIEGGLVKHLAYHQARLNETLKTYRITSTIDLSEAIIAPPIGVYRCRILYRETIKSIEYIPYHPKNIEKISLVTSDLAYTHKYAQREPLEKLLSLYPKSDDILIVKNGYITDTSICNIAFFDGEQWLTPKYPLLYGTTRQRLLDDGFLIPKTITVKDLQKYTHVALMNAMIGFKILNNITVSDNKGILYDY